MKIRINGALAAIVISMMMIVSGVWLTLVLTHNIGVDSLASLATLIGGFFAGSGTPLVTYWREKKFQFDIDSGSSIPPKGSSDAPP